MSRVSLEGRRPLWRATSWLAIGLLSLGFPGSGVAWAAGRTEPAPATSGLAVASDPAGAVVYVDGQLQGSTPLSLGHLLPGDHRVRVVKGGYLDNSRIVSLQPGSTEAVHVRMTPAAREARALTQVEPGEKKEGGGGGKKVLLIALGVAAVGAGVILALPKNKPPLPGTISVSPAGGVAGATSFTFTSQGANDPDGDPLTFSWNFGDGGSGTGSSANHVFANPGAFQVILTVSDGKKSAATPGASVTVKSMSGTWSGNIATVPFPTIVTISQNGTSLSGNIAIPGTPPGFNSGSVRGSVTSPLSVTFTNTFPCCVPFTFNGTVDADVTRLTGTAQGSGFTGQSWVLTKQ